MSKDDASKQNNHMIFWNKMFSLKHEMMPNISWKINYVRSMHVNQFYHMNHYIINLYVLTWHTSTIIESLRAMWLAQYSSATSSSGRPSASLDFM